MGLWLADISGVLLWLVTRQLQLSGRMDVLVQIYVVIGKHICEYAHLTWLRGRNAPLCPFVSSGF